MWIFFYHSLLIDLISVYFFILGYAKLYAYIFARNLWPIFGVGGAVRFLVVGTIH